MTFKDMKEKITWQKLLALLLGNLILGIGVAVLRISGMGNDPFCAMNMALSDGFGIGLGNFQLGVNIFLLILQLIFGRKYLGIGSFINLFLVGYIIQYVGMGIEFLLGNNYKFNLVIEILVMLAAILLITFGLSMYQTADMGVAPYDYLSIGMTDSLPTPYFLNRVITDAVCVCVILVSAAVGFFSWKNSHLGAGTIVCAFFLGPLINAFSKLNKKWITP